MTAGKFSGGDWLRRDFADGYLGSARDDTLNSGHRALRARAYMRTSGLRDFAASVNHVQFDRHFRGEAPLSIERMSRIARQVNRMNRVYGENTQALATFERIHEGLKARGIPLNASVTAISGRKATIALESENIAGLHLEVLTERHQTLFDPDNRLRAGDRISVSVEGYSPHLRRFIFAVR